MKIEKPKWYYDPSGKFFGEEIKSWFDKYVEPVNSMLEDAVEVHCQWHEKNENNQFWSQKGGKYMTHKALLICIEEIKPKTKGERAIELLDKLTKVNESFDVYSHWFSFDKIDELKKEAKQILEGEL